LIKISSIRFSEVICYSVSSVIINVLGINALLTCDAFSSQETDYEDPEICNSVIFFLLFRDCVGVVGLFVENIKFFRVQKECR
jgi:hypothetical protein